MGWPLPRQRWVKVSASFTAHSRVSPLSLRSRGTPIGEGGLAEDFAKLAEKVREKHRTRKPVSEQVTQLRDRIADLLAEEADLATTLATTWGADDSVFPRLHTDWDRLLIHTGASVWTMDAVPDGPAVETVQASGWALPLLHS